MPAKIFKGSYDTPNTYIDLYRSQFEIPVKSLVGVAQFLVVNFRVPVES